MVKAICAVHIAHLFKDANRRLHIQPILNKLSPEQGFSPTILGFKSLDILGGALSIEDITQSNSGNEYF